MVILLPPDADASLHMVEAAWALERLGRAHVVVVADRKPGIPAIPPLDLRDVYLTLPDVAPEPLPEVLPTMAPRVLSDLPWASPRCRGERRVLLKQHPAQPGGTQTTHT